MEALFLDKNYDAVDILDTFSSFIWVDRYVGAGDFEICIPIESPTTSLITLDHYVTQKKSDRYMIVEQLETKTDVDTGTTLIISGRSLESILERRIVWGIRTLTGNFQSAIQTLLNESIINPALAARKIPNFTFRASNDPRITSLTINVQLIGDNLYDAIYALCDEQDLGFRILPNDTGGFIFELYKGVDRSYAQDLISWVVFSPKYDNLLSSNYLETRRVLRTAALVGGEGEGTDKVMVEALSSGGGGSGLSRREMYVEATGVSSSTDEGELTPAQYQELLRSRGHKNLTETTATKMFEGEIDATRQFVYGKDFHIGDVVQVVNEYGMEAQSRVTELIQTHDAMGETYIPTFTTVDDE